MVECIFKVVTESLNVSQNFVEYFMVYAQILDVVIGIAAVYLIGYVTGIKKK
jgi:uncharacterized membrane protein YuzA (DUF378 family)